MWNHLTDMSSANTPKIRLIFKTTLKNSQEGFLASVLFGCCRGRVEGGRVMSIM